MFYIIGKVSGRPGMMEKEFEVHAAIATPNRAMAQGVWLNAMSDIWSVAGADVRITMSSCVDTAGQPLSEDIPIF